jgi:4-hydroxythreonine-4-phosphate dehydrogenase
MPNHILTDSTKPLAITMGDPGGIGPEVIVKSWMNPEIQKIERIVIGDPQVMEDVARRYEPSLVVRTITRTDDFSKDPGVMDVLIPSLDKPLESILTESNRLMAGRWSYACVKHGVDLSIEKKVAGIVTAPLNKKMLHAAGYQYPGHTELIAELTKTRHYGMMLVGGPLRVILVTTHIPFRDIASKITKERVLETIRLAKQATEYLGLEQPKIAVAALNPHAGEASLFGDEEATSIFPAILEARSEGIDVDGPVPADTLFAKAAQGRYSIVVSQYHDQGLIPLKMLSFGEGINVTVGIPIIRTSVDHGTAYDIVGKGVANPGSMTEAIKLAHELVLRVEKNAKKDH